MRKHLYILFFLIPACGLMAQQPKHEVRAVWLTTAYGLDWPAHKANTPEGIRRQKEDLLKILDKLSDANFNTVMFQARTRGDVFYQSAIEPYNAVLTGRTGGNPGYDPLAFAVEECHKRGMECHAWIVAIPLGNKKHANSFGKNALPRKHPEMCVAYGNDWYLNPGHPATKQYLMKLVTEITAGYDVDGIHLDYIRYPERAAKFADSKEYKRYANGRSLQQWRRDNLTEIVRYIYKGVKTMKPWVKVSSSPVGKYDDTARYTSRSWNAYRSVCQDVKQWLAEGVQDQVYPMMYFRKNNFYPFALDWQEDSNDRHIVPGLGVYFLHPSEGDWPVEEIERQIYFIRKNGLAGEAHYRAAFLTDNTQGLYDKLKEKYYRTPALQPPMPWLDSVPPPPPGEGKVRYGSGYADLSWSPPQGTGTGKEVLYVVYASDSYPVDTDNPANIVAGRVEGRTFTHAPLFPWDIKSHYAVSATDRYGNESEAIQLISEQGSTTNQAM